MKKPASHITVDVILLSVLVLLPVYVAAVPNLDALFLVTSSMRFLLLLLLMAMMMNDGLCECDSASTCFYLPNINLKGGTYDEFDASDITQCCIQCASQPCCAGYTYSKALKRFLLHILFEFFSIFFQRSYAIFPRSHSPDVLVDGKLR